MKNTKYRKEQVSQQRVLVDLWRKYAPNKSFFGLSSDSMEMKVDELDKLVSNMAASKRQYRADMLRREKIASRLLDWRLGVLSGMKGDPTLGPAHHFLVEMDLVPRKNCTGCPEYNSDIDDNGDVDNDVEADNDDVTNNGDIENNGNSAEEETN